MYCWFCSSDYGFAWFYLGIHSQAWHGGGPPRYSALLSVHGEIVATVRGLHSFKLSNLWLLEINTQPSSWDFVWLYHHSSPPVSVLLLDWEQLDRRETCIFQIFGTRCSFLVGQTVRMAGFHIYSSLLGNSFSLRLGSRWAQRSCSQILALADT